MSEQAVVEPMPVAEEGFNTSLFDPSTGLYAPRPNIDHVITEDGKPVDNLPSEKNQRLLTEALYSSWAGPGEGRVFLAAANVGIFRSTHQPAVVPDMFLSLDVQVAEDWWEKQNRS